MSKIIAETALRAELRKADEPNPGNPIHSNAGARDFGFRAALVGGATVYGWAVRTIVDVLGERWLHDGWAQIRFRRPVYPDDALHVRVFDDHSFSIGPADADVDVDVDVDADAVTGQLGSGTAPWLGELAYPSALTPQERAESCPPLTPDNVPVGRDLASRLVTLSVDEATSFAREQERETLLQFYGDAALVHPAWLASQPIYLLHHSYDYGPAIHAMSHIQHLARARAGQTFLVAGRCVAAYARHGHQYVVNDCLIRDGAGHDVARIRHTVIYQVAKR